MTEKQQVQCEVRVHLGSERNLEQKCIGLTDTKISLKGKI